MSSSSIPVLPRKQLSRKRTVSEMLGFVQEELDELKETHSRMTGSKDQMLDFMWELASEVDDLIGIGVSFSILDRIREQFGRKSWCMDCWNTQVDCSCVTEEEGESDSEENDDDDDDDDEDEARYSKTPKSDKDPVSPSSPVY